MRKQALLIAAAVLLCCAQVCASSPSVIEPYPSYTFDFFGNPVPAAQAYIARSVVDGNSLGITPLREPRDIAVAQNGEVFIADTGNNRILHLDKNFGLIKIIDGFSVDGQTENFSAPVALYLTERGRLYIADRDNARLVELTVDGEFIRIIGPPQTDLKGVLPENFTYRPFKVAADQGGRIYVLADGIYEGLLEFDVDGNFRGFIGAPLVRPSILERFWLIATKEQRSRMALFLPTNTPRSTSMSVVSYVAEGMKYGALTPVVLMYCGAMVSLNQSVMCRLPRNTGFLRDPLDGLHRHRGPRIWALLGP